MTERESSWAATSEPEGDVLARAVRSAFDTTLGTVGPGATFADKVLAVFTYGVWSLHRHPLLKHSRETGKSAPMLTAVSAATFAAAVDEIAGNLRALAETSGVRLDDAESLAEILARLAHAVLLVPDPSRPMHSQADVDDYAQRHLAPMLRYTVGTAGAAGARGASTFRAPPLRRRRLRMEWAAVFIAAAAVGSAVLLMTHLRPMPPSVMPANLTGSVPAPTPTGVVAVPLSALPSAPSVPSTPLSPVGAQAPPVVSATPTSTPQPVVAPPPSPPTGNSPRSQGPGRPPDDAGALPGMLPGPPPTAMHPPASKVAPAPRMSGGGNSGPNPAAQNRPGGVHQGGGSR